MARGTWRYRNRDAPNPYEEEHAALIRSIREGNPLNETVPVAEATLTAIMGRESAYSGKTITWEEALNSKQDFTLEVLRLLQAPGHRPGPDARDVRVCLIIPSPVPSSDASDSASRSASLAGRTSLRSRPSVPRSRASPHRRSLAPLGIDAHALIAPARCSPSPCLAAARATRPGRLAPGRSPRHILHRHRRPPPGPHPQRRREGPGLPLRRRQPRPPLQRRAGQGRGRRQLLGLLRPASLRGRAGPGGGRRDRAPSRVELIRQGDSLPGRGRALRRDLAAAVPLHLATRLEQRPERAGVLRGRVAPVLPAQPGGLVLGQHALGARGQRRPRPLAGAGRRAVPLERRRPRARLLRGRARRLEEHLRLPGRGPSPRWSWPSPTPRRGESLAYSNDRGRTFTAYEGNPVVEHKGRDPKILWHEATGRWVMVGLRRDRGARDRLLLLGGPEGAGGSSRACPASSSAPSSSELPIDGGAGARWVVFAADGEYVLGSFDGRVFRPDHEGKHRLWHGNFYASQLYSDAPDGRRVQIGWARGNDYPGMPFNQGMTVPVDLSLRKTTDGPRLFAEPVPELRSLRADHRSLPTTELQTGRQRPRWPRGRRLRDRHHARARREGGRHLRHRRREGHPERRREDAALRRGRGPARPWTSGAGCAFRSWSTADRSRCSPATDAWPWPRGCCCHRGTSRSFSPVAPGQARLVSFDLWTLRSIWSGS